MPAGRDPSEPLSSPIWPGISKTSAGRSGQTLRPCVRDSLDGISLGGLVREAHTAERDLVRQAHTAVWDLTVWYCLSEEEVALAGPDAGITDDEYAGMMCTVEAFGGLEGLADAYKTTDPEEFADGFLTNASGC